MPRRFVAWLLFRGIALSVLFLLPGLLLPAWGQDEPAPPDFPKAKLDDAEKLIKEVFKEEYARAKTDADSKRQLAGTLLAQSDKIKRDDDVRYVALVQARDLATVAGDQELAFAAIARLSRYHRIDVLQMEAATVETLLKTVNDAAKLKSLAELSFERARTANNVDRFEMAVRMARLAVAAAKKGGHTKLAESFAAQTKDMARVLKRYKHVQPFLAKLKTNPDDAKANFEAGMFWCFARDRWGKGLAHLAKGSDPALRKVAKKDLERPRKVEEQVELAAGWARLAEKHQDQTRLEMYRRAFQWYKQAMPQLKDAARKNVEQKIQKLTKLLPARYRVTDIAVEIRRFTGHTAEVLGLAFSPDGLRAVTCGADRTLRLWDITTGKEVRVFKGHIGTVFSVAFAADGKHIISGSEDRTVRLWDAATGKELRRLPGTRDLVNAVAVSRDGKFVAAGGQDRTIYLWELDTGKLLKKLTGHRGAIFRLAFSPDGKRLASTSDDETVRLWDVASGKELKQMQGHSGQVLGLSFSPDGRRLLSSGEDRSIRLWDLATGKEVRRYTGHTSSVGSVAFAPDGVRFVSGGDDRTLRLWDSETGAIVRVLKGHEDAVYGVAFSPDGRHALSCSLDKTARLWGERR